MADLARVGNEIQEHLVDKIIPFWEGLRDNEFGGYYGYMSHCLKVDKRADKGCILNSRILWFFSNAYLVFGEERYLKDAAYAFQFMKNYCVDKEEGGVYWSVSYDGLPEDETKHTYNQAFAIYALSSYYDASKDVEALEMARNLFHIIETRCVDDGGYKEALDRYFHPIANDKLSENGVMADRTMNTLLHIFEAYTELFRVNGDHEVKEKMIAILKIFEDKVYNPKLNRLEVFFDKEMNSIIDLHSFGHDIETAWLIDRGTQVIGEIEYIERMRTITSELAKQVYEEAFEQCCVYNESCNGEVDKQRVWWVQAEAIVGFLNEYHKNPEKVFYLEAVENLWEYIKKYVIDKRNGSEWFWLIDIDDAPITTKGIVEQWKCPYHNGRMCMEVITFLRNTAKLA